MRFKAVHYLMIAMPLVLLLAAMQITTLGGICGLLALPWARGEADRIRQNAAQQPMLFPCLMLLLGAPLLSCLWSVSPPVSLDMWVRVALLFLAGVMLWLSPLWPRMERTGFTAMAIAFALAAILPLLLLAMQPYWQQTRWEVPVELFFAMGIKRGLCGMSVLIWALAAGLYRLRARALAWGLVLLTGMVIGLMHSLSAQLGFAVGLLTWLGATLLPRGFARALIVLCPVLIVVGPEVIHYFTHYPFDAATFGKLQVLSSGRMLIWQVVPEAGSGRALLGWGMKTTTLLPFTPAQLARIGLPAAPMHPHCSVLQVWLEMGYAGLVLFAAAVGLVLREVHRRMAGEPVLHAFALATVMAYLAAQFSSFSIWQNWWVVFPWLMLAIWRRLPL